MVTLIYTFIFYVNNLFQFGNKLFHLTYMLSWSYNVLAYFPQRYTPISPENKKSLRFAGAFRRY